jgi:hypothetical protein
VIRHTTVSLSHQPPRDPARSSTGNSANSIFSTLWLWLEELIGFVAGFDYLTTSSRLGVLE